MVINFKDIEIAFDFVNFSQPYEHEAYLNLRTGETHWHSEYGDNEGELPEDIDDETKYISLPHKSDLDLGKKLALDFIYQYLPEEIDRIEAIFSSRGAYSKLKHILETKGLIEKWYKYENEAQEKALREWCKLNGIAING